MSETDSVSVQIDASAQAVFEFMADVEKLTLWSFGTWKIVSRDDGLIEGRALANDAQVLLRIDPDPGRMLIDYHLGDAPDALQPRIFVRIVPGPVSGLTEDASTLILTALRGAGMSDDRWARMCRSHGVELDMIKALIESGHDHRGI